VANVTEAKMEAYLATFHEEYVATVERYIPEEARSRLSRYSLLPTVHVEGFVSTQLGAGYEYRAGEAGISITRGSSRVEDLFVDAPPSLRNVGPMFSIGGPNIGISSLTLEGGFPFRFVGEPADVQFYNVRFKAGAWKRDVQFAHLFSTRQDDFWSEVQAVRRAKDEVLPALLDLQQSAARHVDLGTYLRTFKKRTVLVLGDFKEGRDRLEAIRQALDARGYEAILLDEVPDDLNYDLPQKFHAVASVCRFLVFEDSTPAGHIAEMFLAEQSHHIRVVLREAEEQSTFMTRGMGLASRVHRDWSYDPANLDVVIDEAVSWAESLIAELAEQHVETYPWLSEAAEG
jgi:hypothetical protein